MAEPSGSVPSRAKKRKLYLEPGQPYVVPPRTLRHQRKQDQAKASSASRRSPVQLRGQNPECVPVEASNVSESSEAEGHELTEETPERDFSDEETLDEPTGADRVERLQSDDNNDVDDFRNLFPRDRLPNSELTVADAMVMLMAYTSSAGLNWTDMERLVKVMNVLLGSELLPSSQYLLRKAWRNWKDQLVKKHYFCTECGTRVANSEGREFTCPDCHVANSAHNFFAVLNLQKQIEVVLSDKTVASVLFNSLKKRKEDTNPSVLRDITDGALYKKHMQEGSWSDISLTFNTDGAKVFNCNKTSLWPIQCIINELPVTLRWQNILLGGLWFGKGHPPMSKFLEVFVEEVTSTTVMWECEGKELKSDIHAVCCCVDAPARAAVLNRKQFNGYDGCSFCVHKGAVHNRSVKYTVTESGDQPENRTTIQIKEDIRQALLTGEVTHGIKGYTPLLGLPNFDLVWGVCPDYMHCVLEGVCKQLADIWLTNVELPCYIGQPAKLGRVVNRLLNIQPPQFFTRLPRTLEDRKMWKASEWKWWLLFYAVPCLDEILPQKYHKHLCLLVTAIFLLLKDRITKNDVKEAMDKLSAFVFDMQQLYGESAMTFNVHQLLHLPKSVLQLGPLWAHSTFVFESGNGTLLNLVSDANGVPLQVLERFSMHLQLKKLMHTTDLSGEVHALCEQLTCVTAKRSHEASPLGIGIVSTIKDSEATTFVDKLQFLPPSVMRYQRVCFQGQVYHSKDYKRSKRTCNAYFKSIGDLYHELESVYQLEDGRCVLMCSELKCSKLDQVPHISMVQDRRKVLLHLEEVYRICVAMAIGRALYVADMPNLHEKD